MGRPAGVQNPRVRSFVRLVRKQVRRGTKEGSVWLVGLLIGLFLFVLLFLCSLVCLFGFESRSGEVQKKVGLGFVLFCFVCFDCLVRFREQGRRGTKVWFGLVWFGLVWFV